jgi:hypothetical protein
MAVPKKGWRKITVGSRQYFWRAIGTDWGIDVIVVTHDAFQPGSAAQQLRFTFDYDHEQTPFETPTVRGISLRQRAVVAPGVVRAAIERACASTPPFIGAVGLPDVSLDPKTVAHLQALARVG